MPRLFFLLILSFSAAVAADAERPSGRFLFQPQLTWGNGEVTRQGTGYFVKYDGRLYGVTSIHFLNFNAGGLKEAAWLDIHDEKPAAKFSKSLGRPTKTAIELLEDIQHDFLVLPLGETEPPPGYAALEIEAVDKYPAGTKLWFPNKTPDEESGYKWVEAEVIGDIGPMLKVKLLQPVTLRSQSGSPFLNQKTGKVAGMLMGGEEKNGVAELFLCPARFVAKRLESKPAEIPLIESIRED